MRLGRRVSAGLCAFILMAVLVAYPLRAKAMAGAALASVGGATVIAATLAACGIYPYVSEDGQTFGEWGARALTDLVEQYNQQAGERFIQMEVLKAYVAGRTLAIASETWDKLRDFINWCKETFSLSDNYSGVEMGVVTSLYNILPFSASEPDLDTLIEDGCFIVGAMSPDGRWGIKRYALAVAPSPVDIRTFSYGLPSAQYVVSALRASDNFDIRICYNSDSYVQRAIRNSFSIDGVSYDYFWGIESGVSSKAFSPDVPYIPAVNVVEAARIAFSAPFLFSGVTVDTATVSALPELPDSAEWGGLSVYPGTVTGVAGTGGVVGTGAGTATGTGTGVESGETGAGEVGAGAVSGTVAGTNNPATILTPQAVERIIQQGVVERQRPDVRPVEVELGEGVRVDAVTGELVAAEPGTVTITETDIPLSLGDYAIPSLSTVFPFSIPWDIMRIWQALDAEPRFPLQDFSMTLNVPLLFGDAPPTVRFGLDAFPEDVAAKMDDVALVVRYSLLLVACIGFLIFISKFIKF